MWRDVRARAVALDVASVTGITLVTAAVSQRWASLLLDAMFYASESVFGSAVTDRAVETSYYWTRLGYIVPVRALTTALGTWAGFEAFRILLIAGLAAGLFAVARTFTRRLPAIAIVTPLTMSSVVLTFVGTSYLTATKPANWTCANPSPSPTVSCTGPKLPAGEFVTITLSFKVNATSGSISATAGVSSATNDPASGNNSAILSTSLGAADNRPFKRVVVGLARD